MSVSPTRLVVFDCDGTLIDSQHMIVAAMAHAFEAYGVVPLPRAQVLSIVGLSLDEALFALIPDESADKRRSITQGYKDAFYHLRERPDLAEPLFPGTLAAIEAVAARPDTLLGIATGKSQKGLRHMLETHDLARFFVTLQTADDAPSKPHPAMLEQAMREAGVDAANTILIGDTTYDIEMAVNAGAHAFGVDWGYHAGAELSSAGARRVLTHFDELSPALGELWPSASRGI